MMSNSTTLRAARLCFLTTFTRVWLPRHLPFLDLADAPDIETDRRIEFEGIAAGGGFGAAEHHADLHANLIDEDDEGVGAGDRGGEFTQGLAHQAGMEAHCGCRPSRLRVRRAGERGHGVHHQHVDRGGAHQGVANFQGLLAGVGLRDQKVVEIDAKLAA